MTKLDHAKYRFGFTGTLDGTQTHKWVLEGLFGPSYKIIGTKDLMTKGHVAKLDINILLLKHPPQKFETFEDEIQFIITNEKRNKFIRNLSTWILKAIHLYCFHELKVMERFYLT